MNWNNKNEVLQKIKQNINTFVNTSEELQQDPEIIKTVIDYFKKYECSKYYNFEKLNKYPDDLTKILKSYEFIDVDIDNDGPPPPAHNLCF